MDERSRVNVEVDRGSSFTFTRDSSYIVPFFRAYVRKLTRQWKTPFTVKPVSAKSCCHAVADSVGTLLRSLAVTLRRSQVLIG